MNPSTSREPLPTTFPFSRVLILVSIGNVSHLNFDLANGNNNNIKSIIISYK